MRKLFKISKVKPCLVKIKLNKLTNRKAYNKIINFEACDELHGDLSFGKNSDNRLLFGEGGMCLFGDFLSTPGGGGQGGEVGDIMANPKRNQKLSNL